jgi:tetratricopeptide (TPR) repeat protein
MKTPASSPAALRLERLAGYLREDPANPALLAEACEAAIACGAHDRALAYVESAERLSLDGAEWGFRRARLAIARRDLDEATQLLRQLIAANGPHPMLSHDLAYVRFLLRDNAGCQELLESWLAPGAAVLAPEQLQSLQALWLRAAHHRRALEEAMERLRAWQKAGTLQPAAQGVASLIAVDLNDLEAALALSQSALAADQWQPEALVARACVALTQGQPEFATSLLERAFARNADDGRIWSVAGLASLQVMNLPLAQAQLERAVQSMPDHIDSWHLLAWTRLLQGDRRGALEALRQALARDAESAETHGALGLVLAMEGETAQARQHVDTADRLDPQNDAGRYAHSLLAAEGDNARAVEAVTRDILERSGPFGGRLGDLIPRRRPRGSS